MKRLIFPAVMTVALVASAWRVGSAQDQPAATSVSDLSGKWVLASGQPRGSSLPRSATISPSPKMQRS
jgi:hypothetical protein